MQLSPTIEQRHLRVRALYIGKHHIEHRTEAKET